MEHGEKQSLLLGFPMLLEIRKFRLDKHFLECGGISVIARGLGALFQGLWGSQGGPWPRMSMKVLRGTEPCILVSVTIFWGTSSGYRILGPIFNPSMQNHVDHLHLLVVLFGAERGLYHSPRRFHSWTQEGGLRTTGHSWAVKGPVSCPVKLCKSRLGEWASI